MKTSILALVIFVSSISFSAEKIEKVTCFVDDQKVSESLRTTLTDGQFESRTAQTILFDLKTNRQTTQQEIILVAIERKGDLEIQSTRGVYIPLTNEPGDNKNIQKIDSIDTYQIQDRQKTLIKSNVDGVELILYSVDTEIQLTDRLKIYTSTLINKEYESASLKNRYSCLIQLL